MSDDFGDRIAEEIRLAAEARQVLENPAFQKAFKTVNDSIMEWWRNSPAKDTAARERYWLAITLLDLINGAFASMVKGGTVAQDHLDYLKTAREADALNEKQFDYPGDRLADAANDPRRQKDKPEF